ncbi:hypothetical protein FZZ85_04395 [Synechococcus sp. MU1642]|nr:hypothetical protein [Synechococcus sp. MU1642]
MFLLSVLAVLGESDHIGNSPLLQMNVFLNRSGAKPPLGVFAADFVLNLVLAKKTRHYLFGFTGLLDISAVLCFFAS